MVEGRSCSAHDPSDCWCAECLKVTRWEGGAEERFLWKGPKSFVRSAAPKETSTPDYRAPQSEPAVQAWRLRAVERALFLHGPLNRQLGVGYLNFGDAIVAAWEKKDAGGARPLSGSDLLLHERVQRRANAARHQGVGYRGMKPDPKFGRWGERPWRR
jgi:hypothetical protein